MVTVAIPHAQNGTASHPRHQAHRIPRGVLWPAGIAARRRPPGPRIERENAHARLSRML